MADNPSDTLSNRPRGVLSPADREFLRDREAYTTERTREAGYNRKKKIIERTRAALNDFELLLDGLTDEELVEIFSTDTAGESASESAQLWPSGTPAMLGLVVASLYARDLDLVATHADIFVEDGIRAGLNSRGRSLDSYQRLSFNREASIEELHERLLNGEELRFSQFQRLQAEGATVDLRPMVSVKHALGGSVRDRDE